MWMSLNFPQLRRIRPVLLLFLPLLVLCTYFSRYLLPGEALTGYRYAATYSAPPENTRSLHWQNNTDGKAPVLASGENLLLLEGTLAPGQILLIPNFFGSVTLDGAPAQTHFSGSFCFLVAPAGSFSLQVHMPFLRTLHLRVLREAQLQIFLQGLRLLPLLGVLCLVLFLLPGHGKRSLLLTGAYLLLSGLLPERNHTLPGWVFTAKLLYFTYCPLTVLLAFLRRYRIRHSRTDNLIALTMIYSVCLIYYHVNELSGFLLVFGACLQAIFLTAALYLARVNRGKYAPSACIGLLLTLTAFSGLWLSLVLGISGNGWLLSALASLALALFLLRLPAPAARRARRPRSRDTHRTLYFSDLHSSLKKLGFDSRTIQRIDCKCNTSNRHIQHVAEYTRAICIAMGFSAEQTRQISAAALLHDIGKLEIPDAILFDPGKLTKEAFAQLQSHNRLGWQMLLARDAEFFRLAAEVALQHHERIDGTGYMQLKGEEISLPARIVAVADVFDALTAPRVYKQPWSFEDAFSHIVQNRGIHFDSKVVDDFVQCKDTIRQIYDSFSSQA